MIVIKKVMIIGTGGFIGRHVSAHFREVSERRADYGVYCFSGRRDLDVTDFEAVRKVLADVRPDVIINTTGTYSASTPWDYYRMNLAGVINIFEAVLRSGDLAPAIVNFGTAAEYGRVSPADLPIKELLEPRPVSHYGISKSCATLNSLLYHRNYGLNVYIPRVFNALGPGLPSSLLVSTILEQLIVNKSRRVRLGNLDSKRDFIDISDVCAATESILLRGTPGRIYNVCSGRSHSVRDICEMIRSIAGDFEVVSEDSRMKSGDVDDVHGDYGLINSDTGWRPAVGLRESLVRMIEHYEK